MKVLLLGKGGREHALGWKLAQSPRLDRLISLPGNLGLARLGPLVAGDPTDPKVVADVATAQQVDLVVVGPEAPLAAGVTDRLNDLGVPVFGPTKHAARLETSKRFAKGIMIEAGVPAGSAASFTDADRAFAHLETISGPYVVKADGLAAGKGVLVTSMYGSYRLSVSPTTSPTLEAGWTHASVVVSAPQGRPWSSKTIWPVTRSACSGWQAPAV